MLGNALLELGSYEEAEAELHAALAVEPAPDTLRIARDETRLGVGYTQLRGKDAPAS
jgi:hypothetical protein